MTKMFTKKFDSKVTNDNVFIERLGLTYQISFYPVEPFYKAK